MKKANKLLLSHKEIDKIVDDAIEATNLACEVFPDSNKIKNKITQACREGFVEGFLYKKNNAT